MTPGPGILDLLDRLDSELAKAAMEDWSPLARQAGVAQARLIAAEIRRRLERDATGEWKKIVP